MIEDIALALFIAFWGLFATAIAKLVWRNRMLWRGFVLTVVCCAAFVVVAMYVLHSLGIDTAYPKYGPGIPD